MGSGSSGLYSGTKGASQPYALSYHVTSDMLQYDKDRGVFHGGHYDKNPTAKNINSVFQDGKIDRSYDNQKLTYAVDLNGNIIIGKRNGNGKNGLATPHPTLIGGKDPQVQVAGIIEIRKGKIYSFDLNSGHYKPNSKSIKAAHEAFNKLPKSYFSKKKKGGKR